MLPLFSALLWPPLLSLMLSRCFLASAGGPPPWGLRLPSPLGLLVLPRCFSVLSPVQTLLLPGAVFVSSLPLRGACFFTSPSVSASVVFLCVLGVLPFPRKVGSERPCAFGPCVWSGFTVGGPSYVSSVCFATGGGVERVASPSLVRRSDSSPPALLAFCRPPPPAVAIVLALFLPPSSSSFSTTVCFPGLTSPPSPRRFQYPPVCDPTPLSPFFSYFTARPPLSLLLFPPPFWLANAAPLSPLLLFSPSSLFASPGPFPSWS